MSAGWTGTPTQRKCTSGGPHRFGRDGSWCFDCRRRVPEGCREVPHPMRAPIKAQQCAWAYGKVHDGKAKAAGEDK
jgi:hypothetical protein